jgi:hypothetical protein
MARMTSAKLMSLGLTPRRYLRRAHAGCARYRVFQIKQNLLGETCVERVLLRDIGNLQ